MNPEYLSGLSLMMDDLAILCLKDDMDVDSNDGVSLGGSNNGHPPPLITQLSDWPHCREPEDEYDPQREIGQWSNQELADHNLDWQVPTDPFGLVCSLTDHLPGTKLDLVNIGRSLDLLATYIYTVLIRPTLLITRHKGKPSIFFYSS